MFLMRNEIMLWLARYMARRIESTAPRREKATVKIPSAIGLACERWDRRWG